MDSMDKSQEEVLTGINDMDMKSAVSIISAMAFFGERMVEAITKCRGFRLQVLFDTEEENPRAKIRVWELPKKEESGKETESSTNRD